MLTIEVVAALPISRCEWILVMRTIRYHLPTLAKRMRTRGTIATDVALGITATAGTVILRVSGGRRPVAPAVIVVF